MTLTSSKIIELANSSASYGPIVCMIRTWATPKGCLTLSGCCFSIMKMKRYKTIPLPPSLSHFILKLLVQEVFWMLDILMNRFELKELFRPGFPRLMENFYIHDQLVQHFLPRIHEHLQEHGVHVSTYTTKVCERASESERARSLPSFYVVVPDDLFKSSV